MPLCASSGWLCGVGGNATRRNLHAGPPTIIAKPEAMNGTLVSLQLSTAARHAAAQASRLAFDSNLLALAIVLALGAAVSVSAAIALRDKRRARLSAAAQADAMEFAEQAGELLAAPSPGGERRPSPLMRM